MVSRPILIELLLRPDPLAIARRLEAPVGGAIGEPARRLGADGEGAAVPDRRRHADGRPARHDRHHLDLAGVPARHGITSGTIGLAVAMHLGGMYVASPLSAG